MSFSCCCPKREKIKEKKNKVVKVFIAINIAYFLKITRASFCPKVNRTLRRIGQIVSRHVSVSILPKKSEIQCLLSKPESNRCRLDTFACQFECPDVSVGIYREHRRNSDNYRNDLTAGCFKLRTGIPTSF